MSIQRHLDILRAETQQARIAKEAAFAEIRRLKAQLRDQAD
ncbi:hypothetical protein [Thiobaca trueperi]|nr:hypothetical protein [Thiobaca trueperi]